MNFKKECQIIIHFLYYTMILAAFYFFFRYLMYDIMPFLIGFLIAFSLRPAIRKTMHVFHLPHKFISIIYLLLFYGTIGLSIIILCFQGFHFLKGFLSEFPEFYQIQIEPALYSLMWRIQQSFENLDFGNIVFIQEIFIRLNDYLQSIVIPLSSSIVSFISSLATTLPMIILSFFITILSSIFFTMDFPNISRFFMRQFSQDNRSYIYIVRKTISDTILKYIKAYGKLMLITFLELSIGLRFLGVEGSFIIAFIISFFDLLPVIGTSTILFPWILITFLNHHQKLAVGLLIMHLIINLIRQILEPRLVGKQLGIHPLMMLACMFFGVKLFGFLGIFIAPILIQVLRKLNEEGVLHLYK